MTEVTQLVLANAAFFVVATVFLVWAQWRTEGDAKFPGPAPVGPVFKVWFVVIWLVGIFLPLAALVWDGVINGGTIVWAALGPYFVMFVAQVATEIFTWRRWHSPVWVIVPCLYLPWRLYQVIQGQALVADGPQLTAFTLDALFLLWLINIGVHFTNIPNAMRWGFHPADAEFPSLKDPRVIVSDER